jgi:hypothetical protein
MPDVNTGTDSALEYINTTNYKKLVSKINNIKDVSFDLTNKSLASRRLRYAEVDVELERKAGRLSPDEIYVPLHIIDTNIRREQSAYIQFITQSPRMVIASDNDDHSFDLSLLEKDLTEKLRFDGWQPPMYANVDGFQANGYGIMETVLDMDNPGKIGREYVQFGDFSFIADTRDLQRCEMIGRAYYFTKTKLITLVNDEDDPWDKEQVNKLTSTEPNDEQSQIFSGTTTINRSLYKVYKILFRVKGVVNVGWACPITCDGWLRAPRKLYVGRRTLHEGANKYFGAIQKAPQMARPLMRKGIQMLDKSITDEHIDQMEKGFPASDPEYETMYPYFLYPYLISENDTIACLKGRVFLDQDTQNAASSLMSSTLTKARNSAGLYFSKDASDPNDDFLMQKNIYFKRGALINGKVKEFQLTPPAPEMFTAINLLISANQQETSQINFAETNRQNDSRKTATAIKASMSQQQQLSSVQVTLFSVALKAQLTYESMIIRSRVMCGLIKVNPILQQMYARNWTIKPSGDVDVIEKQQMIQTMQQAWPVVQSTGAAQLFMTDLLEKMFPDNAAKYVAAIQQQQQQQNSQQQQQMQQMMGQAKQVAQQIIQLSKEPTMFSETGVIHALPIVKDVAGKLQQLIDSQKQTKGQ